ncbi:metallopeptidase TldD-related protein, partial [Clostridioides difficile]|uniref:metallopeptidase TldD-related protein n=1 Tax=Clostridioides difficile TaxID=1496 RepID=UPI001F437F52
STPFDDEGVATFKKEVVLNGKLITLLHNLKTANKAGVKTTGNVLSKDTIASLSNIVLYLPDGILLPPTLDKALSTPSFAISQG